MFKRILVAVDGSNDADVAIQTAVEIADAHGSEFHICHVFHIPEHYSTDLGDSLRTAVQKDAEDILAHSRAVAEGAAVAAETHLLGRGHPAEAIIELADKLEVELIVVGVRGTSKDVFRPLGSVSGAVASGASSSVLLVRRQSS
jgi:nucleotide-binding universal stress UspA family protein